MGRPKDTNEKRRITVVLAAENDDFVRKYAESRSINLSTAANILFSAIRRGNYDVLKEACREHHTGRQF